MGGIKFDKDLEKNIDDNLWRYSKTIKNAIKSSGKTQSEVAQEVGVSNSTMSEWVKGRYFPKPDKAKELAEALKMPPEDLLGTISIARKSAQKSEYSVKELSSIVHNLQSALKNQQVSEAKLEYLTKEEQKNLDDFVVQKTNQRLNQAIEITQNIAFQLWSYPYIREPVTRTRLKGSNFLNTLPRITLPDSMMGQYAKKNNVVLLSMPDRGMNKIFNRLALLGVDVDADIKKLDGEIVAYWRHNKFFVRRMFLIKNEDKYIMRPESRIPVFVDTVLKPDEFELIGKVVMYTNTI